MQILKRITLIIIILVTVAVVFRGCIFRHMVTYKSFGIREEYTITDPTFKNLVDGHVANQDLMDITDVINSSLSLTSKQLHFTASNNELDPNQLVTSRTAHCVGYTNFFATVCNSIIQKQNLSDEWKATARIGHLYLFGTDIHVYFKTSFFKDHDFVTLENKTSGEVLAVDPTLHDYSCIRLVRYQSE